MFGKGKVCTALVTLMLAGGGEASVQAASLFTDNDCGSNCYSDKDGSGLDAFVYYKDSNTMSYKNGNYRLSRLHGTDRFYRWGINTGDSTTRMWNLTVWIDGSDYNSNQTRYYLSGNWAGTISQISAPAGYNWVGGANDYGVVQVAVNSRDYAGVGWTGADQVNIWY